MDKEGHKGLLGMYISKNESANFSLSVLTDLQNRGMIFLLLVLMA